MLPKPDVLGRVSQHSALMPYFGIDVAIFYQQRECQKSDVSFVSPEIAKWLGFFLVPEKRNDVGLFLP